MFRATSGSGSPYAHRMQALLDLLARELERPRILPKQVLAIVSGTYGVARDGVGEFFDRQTPQLDDAEIDLLLSPVYTPKLADQAPFAALLARESVAPQAWPDLVAALEKRPTLGRVATENGSEHAIVLRPVTIERFVHRLRLEGSLSEPVAKLILSRVGEPDRPWVLAVGRRAVWDTDARVEILARYLVSVDPAGPHFASDLTALLHLMETSLPESVEDLQKRLPSWEETLRTQLASAASPKPFFNLRVEELHGGGRDQRRGSAAAAAQHQAELEFLRRLKNALEI